MSHLFSKLKIRDLEFQNRIFVSPMCQYSAQNGLPNDWHFVHLGSRAVGGAALIMAEATAVTPEGRISPGDLGIWSDAHTEAFTRITRFIKGQGVAAGVQIAHAGRKASTDAPWNGERALNPSEGGWIPLAPSAIPFRPEYAVPKEMSRADIQQCIEDFRQGTRRCVQAGFDVIEIHMAHGYLFHEFLSPLANHRSDEYGGSFQNRIRFPLEVARVVREVWPVEKPVFVRISATDWIEGGWDIKQSIEFCRHLKEYGIDLIDCSSGGIVPRIKIPVGPGYQVPFAADIRREARIATGAVGMITRAQQAEEILAKGEADAVFIAREMLRRPYWPLHAAHALHAPMHWPKQYERAKLSDVE
jgi:2,4-dienoyl-CoA reductase-like NADH-dependent reductase (Old Yellow Enzyme family)